MGEATRDLFKNLTKDYIEQAQKEMLVLLKSQPSVSIDDVYAHCPPPEYVNTSRVMRRIFMDKDFRRIATRQSKRAGAQNRYVGVYEMSHNPVLA